MSRSYAERASVVLLLALVAASLVGQGAPPPSLTLLSKEGRRAIALAVAGGREYVALDELASVFQLTVREESGAITVSYQGRTIVLTPEQSLASVAGRLVSLSAPVTRINGKLSVPLDFIARALAPMSETRVDLRAQNRLLIIGDLRVPRVAIRHEPLGDATRIILDATPRATSVVSHENQRLVVRFDADTIDAIIPTFQPQGFVQAIGVADPTTLALDLGPRFGTYRATSEQIENTTRLTIDVMSAQAEAPPAPVTSPSPPAVEPPVLTTATATLRTIVVDPGHGGTDVGAVGPAGTVEKDLTLTVARRVKTAVEGRLGIRVLLTRDDDRNPSLDDRAAIANNNKADLFISLHANASPRPSAGGATIYTASFGDQQASDVLAPERVPVFGGGLRDIELVPWELAQVRYIDQSSAFAQMLDQRFHDRVPLDTPSVDSAPLRVLRSTNMPAVLIEMGYLTNSEQEPNLIATEFQTTFVQAIYEAVIQFRDSLSPRNGADQ